MIAGLFSPLPSKIEQRGNLQTLAIFNEAQAAFMLYHCVIVDMVYRKQNGTETAVLPRHTGYRNDLQTRVLFTTSGV